MSNPQSGRFVWYELMTTDPKAAIAFYGHVVGWKTEPFPGGSAEYQMWVASQGALGGVVTLPEPAKQMGAPPHWMAHVTVANVDERAALVTKLGGKILVPPMDVPTVGRFVVIADPQGAALSLFAPASAMEPHDTSKPGEFCWNELVTSDHEAAFRFYSELLGWKKLDEFDMGAMGKYLLYGQDGAQYGGMFTAPKEMQRPSAWLYYIEVSDFDAALERAKEKGATVLNGPHKVPTGQRIVQLADPQSVIFALHGV